MSNVYNKVRCSQNDIPIGSKNWDHFFSQEKAKDWFNNFSIRMIKGQKISQGLDKLFIMHLDISCCSVTEVNIFDKMHEQRVE